ncbi:MAG TPA: creatininase family protein [Roseomonas sp.]|jgi:creatinine amidohydrolase
MDQTTEWMRLTAAELNARAAAGALVIIPIASLEQHGPHLATGVDILCATEVAARTAAIIAAAGEPVVVTPCIWTGLAEHHMDFGGTVTLDYDAFFAVIRGVVRSAARGGFKRVMLLNGHGGNAEAVAVAASELSIELGIAVAAGTYWHLVGDAFAPILETQPSLMHACEAETSMIMAIAPSGVRRENLPAAHGPHTTRVEGQPSALYRRRTFRDVTESGVIGDARTATAEKGEKLLDTAAAKIAAMLRNPQLW